MKNALNKKEILVKALSSSHSGLLRLHLPVLVLAQLPRLPSRVHGDDNLGLPQDQAHALDAKYTLRFSLSGRPAHLFVRGLLGCTCPCAPSPSFHGRPVASTEMETSDSCRDRRGNAASFGMLEMLSAGAEAPQMPDRTADPVAAFLAHHRQ